MMIQNLILKKLGIIFIHKITGPYKANMSSRELTYECSKLGGYRNLKIVSNVNLNFSYLKSGIFCGIGNLNISLSLLASSGLSLP